MKIILFSRRQLSHTAAEICQLFDALCLFGFDYAVNEEFAPLVTELTGMQIPPEKVYGQCIGQQPADEDSGTPERAASCAESPLAGFKQINGCPARHPFLSCEPQQRRAGPTLYPTP